MNELVSIVLPVFNGEKYLDEAIKSCLEQTYSNIEIIGVNDGSNDNSLEILKSYGDKLVVKSQKNKGVSAATNFGIHSMKGQLFKIMNADDILYPDCVESLVSEFDKLNNKKNIIHGYGETIGEKGEFVRDIIHPNLSHLTQFEQNVILLHHNTIIHTASLFHGETFFHCGYYNESLKAAVDYDLWLRLCFKFNYTIHLLEQKVVKRRVVKNAGITAIALKDTPIYHAETRNLILNQLDELSRNRYKIALKKYTKKQKKQIRNKPKGLVNKIILGMFSPSKAKKISETYRKFKKK